VDHVDVSVILATIKIKNFKIKIKISELNAHWQSYILTRCIAESQNKARALTWFDVKPATSCGWPSSFGVTWTTRYVTAPTSTVNEQLIKTDRWQYTENSHSRDTFMYVYVRMSGCYFTYQIAEPTVIAFWMRTIMTIRKRITMLLILLSATARHKPAWSLIMHSATSSNHGTQSTSV